MLKKYFITLFILLFTSSCLTYSPVVNTDLEEIDFSELPLYEKGSDCSLTILGFLTVDDSATLLNAVRDAKISKVKVVDNSYNYALFPFFTKRCITVYGTR